MSKFKKILITSLFLLVAIPIFVFGYAYFKLNSIHEETNYQSKIEEVEGITNILLTGTDARLEKNLWRILSYSYIDNTQKYQAYFSSCDTYVQLPGRAPGKLNAAYFWGQEPMLFETIENEFGIGIDKIIQVDFNSLMSIVDTLGGVEVNVPENNINEINKYAKESYKFYNSTSKGDFQPITHAGTQTLNGYQALSFARVRKVDSAIARDNRQKEVLMAIADKAKSLPVTKYPSLLNSLLPYVKTNIPSSDLLKYGLTAQIY